MASDPRVACIGGLHIDITAMSLDPIRPATSNPVRTSARYGGVAANVAQVLAALGDSVVLCSAVGDEAAGSTLETVMRGKGIDTAGVVKVRGSVTARYTAVVDPDGSLFVGIADAAIYDRLGGEWVATALGAADPCDIWVLDTNLPGAVIEAIVGAAGGRLVVADPVSVPKSVRLTAVLEDLSVVFPDTAELRVLTGESESSAAAAALHRRGPAVVATLGAKGVLVARDGAVEARPARSVPMVVDETGAGDALLAGYLHGVIRGDDDPVAWGLAAAALAVSEEGSVPPGLTRPAVEAMVAAAR
jgi:pseudouridine kinase